MIFQILQKQNHRIVRATEQLERTVVELEFSQKWFKGKHTFVAPKDQPEREEEELATKTTTSAP